MTERFLGQKVTPCTPENTVLKTLLGAHFAILLKLPLHTLPNDITKWPHLKPEV
jgi:hypothetical protein